MTLYPCPAWHLVEQDSPDQVLIQLWADTHPRAFRGQCLELPNTQQLMEFKPTLENVRKRVTPGSSQQVLAVKCSRKPLSGRLFPREAKVIVSHKCPFTVWSLTGDALQAEVPPQVALAMVITGSIAGGLWRAEDCCHTSDLSWSSQQPWQGGSPTWHRKEPRQFRVTELVCSGHGSQARLLSPLCGRCSQEHPQCSVDMVTDEVQWPLGPQTGIAVPCKGCWRSGVCLNGPGGAWVNVGLAEEAPLNTATEGRNWGDRRHLQGGDCDQVKSSRGKFEESIQYAYRRTPECVGPVKPEGCCIVLEWFIDFLRCVWVRVRLVFWHLWKQDVFCNRWSWETMKCWVSHFCECMKTRCLLWQLECSCR